MHQFSVKTHSRVELVDITDRVRSELRRSTVRDGACLVFVPHTTAGVTINENADPDVVRDIIAHLEKLVPANGNYRHSEGNSDAHIKASLMGFSLLVPVEAGQLALGRWQGIYLCEFDGPRTRKVYVSAASYAAFPA
ncbi:MAG TPA: secondary thiamine-phosphate synthase enzyme YjbQ [Planctomycetota bacterium]|nr:secondary thiamine-phosphate synthase enzyme YjbQ [Planctomycetota bacterium]